MTKDKAPDTDTSSAGAEGARNQPGALGLLLPPDRAVWAEARRLVGNKNIRVEDLAICAAQDPIIVIELLRIANAMFFSGGRSPITSAKSAIIRLGSDVVLETLDKIGERPDTEDPKVSVYVEEHRQRAKRFSIVATILSEALARNLTEDAQTSALFASMGELLAAAFFKKTYVELAAGNSRSSLHYRLVQDHKFDCEKMGVLYLRRNGIPEAILFALDRQAASRVPERAILRPLCQAAVEMCDAFDGKRWEKLAPGKPIPPKSAIRMLQIPDAQYLKIYERASEYLFSAKVIEDMRREGGAPRPAATSPAPASTGDSRAELDSEIGALVKGVGVEFEEELAPPQPPSGRAASPGERAAQVKVAGAVKGVVESREVLDQFGLSGAKAQPKKVARSNDVKLVEPPVIHTPNGTTIVTAITDSFENATRSEDLLAGLLQALVDKGPFEKSALIVVSKDRRSAVVVAARGPNIGNGQKLSLDDPLSPLAQCFSKVQSFGNKESPTSPFGSKAFALSPIDADHDTPVALYADCGNSGSLSFEARRIFRTVVDVLNQKLPSIPGGIPVEISVP
jgi:HD-like signal output (HDOD) protein